LKSGSTRLALIHKDFGATAQIESHLLQPRLCMKKFSFSQTFQACLEGAHSNRKVSDLVKIGVIGVISSP
jgi:hypothetical protein